MSYSLYTYLKENPKLNSSKVTHNWATLLTDDSVSPSVKAELNELIKHKLIKLTDAILFWSDHVQRERMLDMGKTVAIRGSKLLFGVHHYAIYPEAFSSQFALLVYSYIQLHPEEAHEYASYVYNTIFRIESDCKLFCEAQNWTINKITRLFMSMNNKRHGGKRFCNAYFGDNICVTDVECAELYDWLDESFIARIGHGQVHTILQLLRDCDMPAVKFKSLNEIERAHDERTAREVAKQLNARINLFYHPDLIAVVEKCGFTLPDSNVAMIKRGKAHYNCVATYFDKHCKSINQHQYEPKYQTYTVSRIFFTKDATLELSIEYNIFKIVSTKVIQYKGRFNRDIEWDEKLIALRITLVGMPTDILVVRKVTNERKDEG
jgi:hypothetical protein